MRRDEKRKEEDKMDAVRVHNSRCAERTEGSQHLSDSIGAVHGDLGPLLAHHP